MRVLLDQATSGLQTQAKLVRQLRKLRCYCTVLLRVHVKP